MSCWSIFIVGFVEVTAVVLETGTTPVTIQVGQEITPVEAIANGAVPLKPALPTWAMGTKASEDTQAPTPPPIRILLTGKAALAASTVVLVKQGVPPDTPPVTVTGKADPPGGTKEPAETVPVQVIAPVPGEVQPDGRPPGEAT